MSRSVGSVVAIFLAMEAAVGPVAIAQPDHEKDGSRVERKMKRLDLNGDGQVSPAEQRALGATRFLRWDGDGDGLVTEAEMRAAAKRRIEARIERRITKRFARMDLNGDGRVERAEFEEHGALRFARLDQDGDGQVSQKELLQRHKGRGRSRNHDGQPDN